MDKHVLKMKNLKNAATETRATGLGLYTVISYDMDSGDVIADTYPDGNTWAEFTSDTVIHVCRTNRPMTMQQIADSIAAAVERYRILTAPVEQTGGCLCY